MKRSVKDLVEEYMASFPNSNNLKLYKKFPNLNRSTIRNCRNNFITHGKDSQHLLEQLRWLYEHMASKTVKGIPPNSKEKLRLKAIEEIIGLRD